MSTTSDPIVAADEICELLGDEDRAGRERQIGTLLELSGEGCCSVVAEVQRRGLLSQLLPRQAAAEHEALYAQILAGARDTGVLHSLCVELLQRKVPADRGRIERLILHADRLGNLSELFAKLISGGSYKSLCERLCSDAVRDSPSLRALARARPTYDAERLNAEALRTLRAGSVETYPYDLLIVPGYTPLKAQRPMHLRELPPMQKRVELAAREFLDGRASHVFLTGGSVYPPGTPNNEALMMREHLMDAGVSPSRIVVDPHARHTTTNLRNAGRLMLELSLRRGLIVTGFDSPVFSQAFYLGNPNLSTFLLRCRQELGYSVGDLTDLDDHRIEFIPDPACKAPGYADPLDV